MPSKKPWPMVLRRGVVRVRQMRFELLLLLVSGTLLLALLSEIGWITPDRAPSALAAVDHRLSAVPMSSQPSVAAVAPEASLPVPVVAPAPVVELPQVVDDAADRGGIDEQRLRDLAARLRPPAPVAAASQAARRPTAAASQPANALTFNGRPLVKVRTIRMVVTAYSPDARSCGKWADGITASGKSVYTNAMRLVAADTRILPFGTILRVPGYHDASPVPVLDRGGAIKGHRLDLLFPTHEQALQWGRRTVDVEVYDYAR